ncbi:hypothetical protein [Burkholderia oklahomensis]|uniref:hypothetical protein n=1 Tax=Burkholderia oklahomensis TaxID=342113 RepID=UPI0005D98DB3|nr:hypothetical protein BG90_458 [Burkholderia oklahomensis C6786]MBI0360740.1 hypothetical protein [Burkholderia oklahomensis]SUW60115.1 Uncharacterised protein [Burkholderia oklahomensis]
MRRRRRTAGGSIRCRRDSAGDAAICTHVVKKRRAPFGPCASPRALGSHRLDIRVFVERRAAVRQRALDRLRAIRIAVEFGGARFERTIVAFDIDVERTPVRARDVAAAARRIARTERAVAAVFPSTGLRAARWVRMIRPVRRRESACLLPESTPSPDRAPARGARPMRGARPGGAIDPQPPPDAALPPIAPELPDGAIGAGCTPPVVPVELESAFEPPCFEHEDIAIANPTAVTPTATARHMLRKLRENSGRMAPPAVNESVAQQAACRGSAQRRQSGRAVPIDRPVDRSIGQWQAAPGGRRRAIRDPIA